MPSAVSRVLRSRVLPLAAAALAAAALSGCAVPQTDALLAATREQPRPPVLLQAVPFFPQQDYACGPASLAMAMGAAGRNVTPEALVADVFVPGRQGSLQAEMLAAPRRYGLLATQLPPRLAAVLAEVSAGTPVVVMQNLGLAWLPVWHYAVVVGHDLEAGEIVLHSGTTQRLRMPLAVFERTWGRAERWAIAVTPPARIPVTATESAAVAAAIGLERASPQAALTAYEAILQRWPASRLALFGRGNALLALGDYPRAVVAYREAVAAHPDFADAWNNLAVVLLETGDRPQARVAAERAVSIGGPRSAQYRETLARVGR